MIDGIQIHDLRLDVDPADQPLVIRIHHVEVHLTQATFGEIVAAAAERAGLRAIGSLGHDRIEVAVAVSLLRVRASFRPTVAQGHLILSPTGGLPGWLIGRAASIIGRTDGLSMTRDGQISVDPAPFLPDGIALTRGFTAIDVTPERLSVSLG